MKLTWNKKNLQTAKKRPFAAVSRFPNLPFDKERGGGPNREAETSEAQESAPETAVSRHHVPPSDSDPDRERLAQSFQRRATSSPRYYSYPQFLPASHALLPQSVLLEFCVGKDGKYREALGKWEASLTLVPGNAVLHEQKAQVLLEIGEAWGALRAAARATELDPSWAEAWLTLGRAELNFGEPDNAIQSFDRALAIKPGYEEAQDDRRTALNLVKRRKQLHLSGSNTRDSRFVVSDKVDTS